jgi:outer membrane protein OmpA-like peptidoglycan-associated protein
MKSERQKSDRESAKPPETTESTMSGVQNVDLFFATDSAQLSAAATADLQKLADWARCDTRNAIILEGYADPRGTKNHNLKLSGERAATVREKLIQMGVPSARIVVTVYGENGKRRATNADERRVSARATATPIAPKDLSA